MMITKKTAAIAPNTIASASLPSEAIAPCPSARRRYGNLTVTNEKVSRGGFPLSATFIVK